MYVSAHVCMCERMCVCDFVYIRVYACVHCVYMCERGVCVSVCGGVSVVRVRVCTCVGLCICVCSDVYACVYVHVQVRVYMHVCICSHGNNTIILCKYKNLNKQTHAYPTVHTV